MFSSSATKVVQRDIALVGDTTIYPKSKDNFRIKLDVAEAEHQGVAYAYANDLAACGAKLIGSL